MISLYVNALLCTLQHIVINATQLSGVNMTPLSCIAFMTICCSVHKSALTYKEIIFSTFSNQQVEGGSNMTGTDLCVNKPHCAEAVRP